MKSCIVAKERDGENIACVITLPNGVSTPSADVRETLTNALVEHFDAGVKVPFATFGVGLDRTYSKGHGEVRVYVDTDYEGECYSTTIDLEYCGLF